MGAEIHLRWESDPHDKRKLAPFIGRDFLTEISRGSIFKDRHKFLSPSEIDLLQANFYETYDNDSVKPINPKNLFTIIEKVREYLYVNSETLPIEIVVDFEKMKLEERPSQLIINKSRCWIQGDSHYYKTKPKFLICSFPHEPTKVEQWFNFQEEIEIGENNFYLKKITRYEKYKNLIKKIISFCNDAVLRGDYIYWLYTH